MTGVRNDETALRDHIQISMSSNASERHAGGMPPSEHDDWVIDLGPGGGVNGGEIVVAGTPETVAACEASAMGAYLRPLLERGSSEGAADRKVKAGARPVTSKAEGVAAE